MDELDCRCWQVFALIIFVRVTCSCPNLQSFQQRNLNDCSMYLTFGKLESFEFGQFQMITGILVGYLLSSNWALAFLCSRVNSSLKLTMFDYNLQQFLYPIKQPYTKPMKMRELTPSKEASDLKLTAITFVQNGAVPSEQNLIGYQRNAFNESQFQQMLGHEEFNMRWSQIIHSSANENALLQSDISKSDPHISTKGKQQGEKEDEEHAKKKEECPLPIFQARKQDEYRKSPTFQNQQPQISWHNIVGNTNAGEKKEIKVIEPNGALLQRNSESSGSGFAKSQKYDNPFIKDFISPEQIQRESGKFFRESSFNENPFLKAKPKASNNQPSAIFSENKHEVKVKPLQESSQSKIERKNVQIEGKNVQIEEKNVQIKAVNMQIKNLNLEAKSVSQEFYNILAPYYTKEFYFRGSKTTFRQATLKEIQKRSQSLNPSNYYKPKRVEFKKISGKKSISASLNQINYVCKLLKKTNEIALKSLNFVSKQFTPTKCKTIPLNSEDCIAPSITLDDRSSRIYCYSNKFHQIVVYSLTTLKLICKVNINRQICNPFLYHFTINNNDYLLLIGGYEQIAGNVVQGNKFIYIFEITKWAMNIKPKIIKLVIGRISPFVIFYQGKLLIMGGHTTAYLKKPYELDYSFEKDINLSLNLTGVILDSEQIIGTDETLLFNSLSIQLDSSSPLNLHSAYTFNFNSFKTLIIPNYIQLFQIKISNKFVHITELKYKQNIAYASPEYHQSQINYNSNERVGLNLYRICEDGYLRKLEISSEKFVKYSSPCALI